jgi:uncharacterized iron-regulated membrane protein
VIRWLFLLHRYLGIAVGTLMAMWCLSGVVMMYVSYPALDENSRLRHLAPISWTDCCTISDDLQSDAGAARDFRVEMLSGRPVLYRRSTLQAPVQLVDLITGTPLTAISPAQAANVARSYLVQPLSSFPALLGTIDYDQWTVSDGFDADRPLYHFDLGDRLRTELYVSSKTGRAVQMTTGRERFWNWLGAVPHWLYFAQLRRKPALWSELLIVTSLMGCCLAATGLYIGVRQLLRRPRGEWSTYRGSNRWHHVAGLFFGLFALTWVLSGLLSMNPWGWLEGASAEPERSRLRGPDLSGVQVKAALQAIASNHPPALVSIQMAPLNGRLYFIASARDGERSRLDERGNDAPLSDADLAFIAAALKMSGSNEAPRLITHEETYYFTHHGEKVPLPAYRLAPHDGSATLYYVDPVSGGLIVTIDRSAQGYRWWHEGLHRMDFLPALRRRPQWDILMFFLMSGVTMTCFTGAYLGYRRLTRAKAAGSSSAI